MLKSERRQVVGSLGFVARFLWGTSPSLSDGAVFQELAKLSPQQCLLEQVLFPKTIGRVKLESNSSRKLNGSPSRKECGMGFSGIRAVILVVVLIVLVLGATKLGLPGWLLPVGLLLTAGALKGAEKKASRSV
jgi:hypothetical protein